MFYALVVIGVIAAILLVLVILAQNPKGGINNQLGSGSNTFGVKKTTDILEKSTWVLAVAVLAISIAATKVATTTKKADIDPNIKAAQSGQAKEAPKAGDENFEYDEAAPATDSTKN